MLQMSSNPKIPKTASRESRHMRPVTNYPQNMFKDCAGSCFCDVADACPKHLKIGQDLDVRFKAGFQDHVGRPFQQHDTRQCSTAPDGCQPTRGNEQVTHTRMHTHARMHTHTHTRTHARTQTHTQTQTHTHTHTHARTRTHARTHTHTHTHTHTQMCRNLYTRTNHRVPQVLRTGST